MLSFSEPLYLLSGSAPIRLIWSKSASNARKILNNLSNVNFWNARRKTRITPLTALADRVVGASRNLLSLVGNRIDATKNVKKIVKAAPRLCMGLVLVIWVAPQADVFYTRFDFYDRVPAEVWYYESFHWLFLCLGPYMKSILNVVGLYLCFVNKTNWIKLSVAAFALCYDFGKITWLLQVSNHDEYKALPSLGWICGYGLLCAAVLLLITELSAHWLNHRFLAFKARLRGLRNIVDKADPQIICNGFVKTMDEYETINQF